MSACLTPSRTVNGTAAASRRRSGSGRPVRATRCLRAGAHASSRPPMPCPTAVLSRCFLDSEETSWGVDAGKMAEFLSRECAVKEPGRWSTGRTGTHCARSHSVHLYGHPCDLDAASWRSAGRYSARAVVGRRRAKPSAPATQGRARRTDRARELPLLQRQQDHHDQAAAAWRLLTRDERWPRASLRLTTAGARGRHQYIHEEIGFNSRLPNLQAAPAASRSSSSSTASSSQARDGGSLCGDRWRGVPRGHGVHRGAVGALDLLDDVCRCSDGPRSHGCPRAPAPAQRTRASEARGRSGARSIQQPGLQGRAGVPGQVAAQLYERGLVAAVARWGSRPRKRAADWSRRSGRRSRR